MTLASFHSSLSAGHPLKVMPHSSLVQWLVKVPLLTTNPLDLVDHLYWHSVSGISIKPCSKTSGTHRVEYYMYEKIFVISNILYDSILQQVNLFGFNVTWKFPDLWYILILYVHFQFMCVYTHDKN